MKKIRLIELFAGIGAQAKALERLNIDFEHYRAVEFDKYAMTSYNAIHNTSFETSDITQIVGDDLGIEDTEKYTYIMTYSFPCQDLSLAGKGKGMEKGSGTRSGLLWEVERLLNEVNELPQVLLMENVTQVHGKKNEEDFNKWLEFLESKGYTNYWQDLNAKEYGIPQNRNRCFMVSMLGNYKYTFPDKEELKLRLKDMLESEVDEKFYISNSKISKILNSNFQQEKRMIQTGDICSTLLSRDYKDPKCIQVGNLKGGKWDKINESCRRVYSENGCSPTITTCQGGNTEPKVMVKEATKQGYAIAEVGDSINLSQPNSKTRRGRVGHGVAQTLTTQQEQVVVEVDKKIKNSVRKNFEREKEEIAKTNKEIYQCKCDSGWQDNKVGIKISPTLRSGNDNTFALTNSLRIRKLTPKECWRLMGFDDDDFEKAKIALNDTYYKGADRSNSQLYKQAGNSIVVNVLEVIFANLIATLRSEWLNDLLGD